MTASKTARLGLMSPVGSDAFVTTDFSQTFGVLDANPGTAVVANAASRPTSYTTAQHGSMVFQTDLGILWFWNQPSSGSVGAWARVGSKGLLADTTPSGQVSTTQTNAANGAQSATVTVTVPGGRPVLVILSWDFLNSSQGQNVVSFWEGSTRLDKYVWEWYNDLSSGTFTYARPVVPTQQNITYRMTIAANPGDGGTVRMTGGKITVIEV
jgi:hypothetical protein